MLGLYCTRKILDQFGIPKDSPIDPGISDAALGHWYVNAIQTGRRKSLVFMSERTLLSFLICGMRKDNSKDLPELFIRGLSQLLALENFTSKEIHRCLPEDEILVLAKSTNRKALGNLTDLGRYYEDSIYNEGGLEQCDVGAIIHEANRQPQRNLGWAFSIEAAKELAARDAT